MFENLQEKSVIQERKKNYVKFRFQKENFFFNLRNFIYSQKYIKFQGALSFRTVERRLKRFQNSLTTN